MQNSWAMKSPSNVYKLTDKSPDVASAKSSFLPPSVGRSEPHGQVLPISLKYTPGNSYVYCIQ